MPWTLPKPDEIRNAPNRWNRGGNPARLYLYHYIRMMDEVRLMTLRKGSQGWSLLGPLGDMAYAIHGMPEPPKGGALIYVGP